MTISDNSNSARLTAELFELQKANLKLAKAARPLLKENNELDRQIATIVDLLISTDPKMEEDAIDSDLIQIYLSTLPPATEILTTETYKKPAAPIKILRHALQAHRLDVNDDDDLIKVGFTDTDLTDRQMSLVIWLAMVRGADHDQLARATELLRFHRENAPVDTTSQTTATRTAGQDAAQTPYRTQQAPALREEHNHHVYDRNQQRVQPPSRRESANQRQRDVSIPQDTHEPTAINNYRHEPSSHSTVLDQATQALRTKQLSTIIARFKSQEFDGIGNRSILTAVRDYELCADQIELVDDRLKASYFANVFTKEAREYFLSFYQKGMPYEVVRARMIEQYNSRSMQSTLQAEMDALDFATYKQRKGIDSDSTALRQLVDYINNTAPRLPKGFGNIDHKVQYLRRAVKRMPWAVLSIAQLGQQGFGYQEFINSLHSRILHMHELGDTTHDSFYGEMYLTHPKDVRKHSVSFRGNHPTRPNPPSFRSSQAQQNRRRDNSQLFARNPRRHEPQGPRRNPSIKRQRFCFGCGSPNHFIGDGLCNPSKSSIKTNLITAVTDDASRIEDIAEQFQQLLAERPNQLTAQSDTPETDPMDVDQTVEESLFETQDMESLTAYLKEEFETTNDIHYLGTNATRAPNATFANGLHLTSMSTQPLGFCVDIGAPKSVIGRATLGSIIRSQNRSSIPISSSDNMFTFGEVTVKSQGAVELWLRTPSIVQHIPVILDIVELDIPALLGLDIIDAYGLVADTVNNRLVHLRKGESKPIWHVPLTRADNHVYAEMLLPPQVFYTTDQLRKLHKRFAHPSADKLYQLLKRASREHVSSETLDSLKKIGEECEPCQRIARGPHRFRVSLGNEDTRFNQRVFIDIMYIDGLPILHVIDEATRFSAARFLTKSEGTKVSTLNIWQALIECWAAVYTGMPNVITTDSGSQFRDTFIDICALHDVKVQTTGVESHNSLGIGERYHAPLRNTYRKLKIENGNMQPTLLLQMSVKAMNDTLGPDGIVPSALVFGEFPSLRTFEGPRENRPTLVERARIATQARKIMAQEIAKSKLQRALKHNAPDAADRVFEPGQLVLVWREKIVNNRIGEWLGPYQVISMDHHTKIVLVDCDGESKRFSATQVKVFKSPVSLSRPNTTRTMPWQSQILTSSNFLVSVANALRKAQDCTQPMNTTFLTEVIHPSDPRAGNAEMEEAISLEISDLTQRGAFRVIDKNGLPPNANILPARFVLAIKTSADGRIRYKARYVIGGHRDKLKQYIVHDSQTVHASSIRILVAIAAIFGFIVWSSDVKLAYLQSREPMNRRVFIRDPAIQFGLEDGQYLELLKPLYGLSDSGDSWHATLSKHLANDLGLSPNKVDNSLSFRHDDSDNLIGVHASYVDDLLRAGTRSFREACQVTSATFETSPDEELPFTFAGIQIKKTNHGMLSIDQSFYLKKLEELPKDAAFPSFRSMRMRLAWMANSRPDICYAISQIAQITESIFNGDAAKAIKLLNSTIRYTLNNPAELNFPQLDVASLKLVGYSDGAFANNADLTSQLGRIVLLCDRHDQAAIIAYKSYKSHRVTRSVLGAEVIAFSDLFDDAYAIRTQLKDALRQEIPLHLFTDSKSLFDIISKGSRTSEKRIMLDVFAAREGYVSRNISNIGFVRSEHNIADGLTKPKMQASLYSLITTSKHAAVVEQWIIRQHNSTSAPMH